MNKSVYVKCHFILLNGVAMTTSFSKGCTIFNNLHNITRYQSWVEPSWYHVVETQHLWNNFDNETYWADKPTNVKHVP